MNARLDSAVPAGLLDLTLHWDLSITYGIYFSWKDNLGKIRYFVRLCEENKYFLGHNLHLQRYSKAVWTWSWATTPRWPCLNAGVWPGDLYRPLPSSTMLMWSTSGVFTESLQEVHVLLRQQWVPAFQSEKENNNEAKNGRAFSAPQGRGKWTPFVLDHAVVIVSVLSLLINVSLTLAATSRNSNIRKKD